MGNILIAAQILGTLLQQALAVNQQIAASQASGTDLTPDQLAALVNGFNSAFTQLQSDIAKAQAAGK